MNSVQVSFHPHTEAIPLKYVVIVLFDGDQVLWARHARRATWEIPGGHIEPDETPRQAAERELWEETGITKAALQPCCIYTVSQDERSTSEPGPLPAFEMAEVRWFRGLPDELTYPQIQPRLWRQVKRIRAEDLAKSFTR